MAEGDLGKRKKELEEEGEGEDELYGSIEVCPFGCRRAQLGLQPGFPFKDRPSDGALLTKLGIAI